ncbi:MAG: FAD-dependent oxidoreductase [Candidatus Sumerlaeota bacterium]|nr:FAD-dependent oxidoreductase [Candidatus Sumerlaeota bacterium]
MKTARYELSRDLPVVREADVVVVGGGPGGLGAAVMAARCGANTLLVERYGHLGGMAVSGEVHPFMPNHLDGRPLDQPVYTEWLERMKRYQAPASNERFISKDAAMLAAEDLCLEAGVDILYHHQLADVLTRDGAIEALVLLSKSGLSAVRGKAYADCSGDADLAARAGCQFDEGGPGGHCQPMTLCFKLSHVEKSRAPDRREMTRLYEEAKSRGEIDCPREDVLFFQWFDDDVVHFNTTRVIHRRATDGGDLSEAEIEGRRQLRQFLRFFREHVPGYENAHIHSIAHHIGVRESRRVRGLACLTREAFTQARKCPDAIARVRYPIDIHNPDGGGTEHERLPEGEWYEIPYGCIVARDVDNLLIGGRPISVDHAVHSSMRVMPPACSVGQAAGLAAAVSAQRGCRPRDLDGVEVRRLLVEKGAWLS